ncbi:MULTISPECIES: HlyD family type I secretion periplasmic adaptor subunit [Rhizobium]|uniref:Membrane fusion protein (MFP) family protein n=2 Tax=Rhizobium TaxID=379 RepID=K0Q483_9HYPH|nr:MULTISPECIES: HlyD family type I secretion periplasmic adaptor subunit [Rhizobium]KWV59834.1 hemolysin secretion protein D [Rhizobium altiplani]CCM79890.1 Type I secretion membrane fusion protein, HlyD family [Rhizobium mesoamericanum STM3625]
MSGSIQHRSSARRSLSRHMIGVSALALALVVGVGGWATTTELSSAVVAGGVVAVEDNVKKIQHLTGGIVGELLVREGDRVKAGQVLIRLNGTTVRSNLAIVESTLAQLYARRARLQAERIGAPFFSIDEDLDQFISGSAAVKLIEGEQKLFTSRNAALAGMKSQLASRKAQLADEIEGLTVQVKAIEDALKLFDEELTSVDSLYGRGLVPMQRVTTLKRQRAELEGERGQNVAARAQARGKSSEIDLQILQLDEDRRTDISKDLTEVEAKIAEYEERRTAATDELRRLDITAPLPGRVYQLAVHTVNGVINPGETLMLVVPEAENLTIEARVATHDIDQIRVGQPVEIRFSAFNQRTTPEVEAEVMTVAPDLVTDERTGASYYPLRIRPKPESLAKLKGLSLYPGMPAEVFIKIADRTVISYLTKPLTDQMRHAFRED